MPTTVTPEAQAGEHGEERGHPLEGGAVAGAGGYGHDRCRREAADHTGQRTLHAGDHHHHVGHGQLVDLGQQPVEAGHAAVDQEVGREPESALHGRAFVRPRAGPPCRP